jgi:putative ABC transport system ATP-binding protein
MSFVQAQQLVKQYGSGDSQVTAISDINFEIEAGDFVAIMGESGAGKSTLLSVLGAINEPTDGNLTVDDIDVYDLSPEQRADFRREYLGFVFQSFHLVPYLTVLENVMLPLAVVKAGRKVKREMAAEALEQVDLLDKADRLPNQISGGEKERVAVARAVVNNPPVLLADEPTGNLDTGNSREIMKLLQSLNRDGTTIVMVTHSNDCARFARRTLQVSDGTIVGESHNLPTTAENPN